VFWSSVRSSDRKSVMSCSLFWEVMFGLAFLVYSKSDEEKGGACF